MRIFVLTKRTLLIGAIMLAILVALLIVILSSGNAKTDTPTMSQNTALGEEYELEVLAGKKKELPVYSVERTDKKIALTIDAAWEDDKTDFILEELDRQGIKATFYLCGFWVDKYPEHVKAIVEHGHELGNHTQTHPHMNQLDTSGIQKELTDLDNNLEAITGQRSKTFRAPYGEYNDLVITTSRAMGYMPVQWSIDTIDWKEERSAQTILDTVLPKLTPGCIILCHNNGFKIKEYLPTLITQAKEQGYEFVTVSELLLSGKTMIDVNGVQKPAS